MRKKYVIKFEDKRIDNIIQKDGDSFLVQINNNQYHLSLNSQSNDPRVICSIDDQKMVLQIRKRLPRYQLVHKGKIAMALISEQRFADLNELMPEKIPQDMSKFLLSPMPGLLIKVCVKEGQEVKAGEELAVVEAMKMENSLRASKDLKIKSILGSEGDNLSVDQKFWSLRTNLIMNSTGELLSQVIKGDRKSIAKTITLVESKKPQDRALADDLLNALPEPVKILSELESQVHKALANQPLLKPLVKKSSKTITV